MTVAADPEKGSHDTSINTAFDGDGSEKVSDHGNGTAPSPRPSEVNPWDPSRYPDGGFKAWMSVVGAFCCVFCSFGWINCIGVFQEYYQTHQLRDYSPSAVSWISSLQIFMIFAGGPIVGRIFDIYGPRYLILFGTFFHVFGLMMTSLCTEYYQILLAQGVCSSIGICCLFTPGESLSTLRRTPYPNMKSLATNCVSTWFFKKRAFAMGITASGGSLGGVIFPIMFARLARQISFNWAIRISAFLILAMLTIGNLTVQSRLPPRPKPVKLFDYVKPLTERVYLLTTIASFIFYLGLFVPINYIQLQATTSFNMSPALAAYLIPILNAASLFGRIIPGWVADRIGRFNTMIAMCLFSGIIVLALWIPTTGNAALIVFAAMYGFGSGAFVSLLYALVPQISDIKEIGLRIGLLCAIISVAGLVSNPIGGALIVHDDGGFRDLQIYCGVILLAGSGVYVLARMEVAGWKVRAKA
ncbi:hypothetical protein FQN50_005954 [Emmonsiellopsis sp. PD_5]|nr:hypothetical protein FQN50_005954 [Emmonsiellopsis sp. PD_5]